jgi:hypothetical protein
LINADRIVTMKRVLGYLHVKEYTAVQLTDGFKLDVIETPEQVLAAVKSASAGDRVVTAGAA